MSLPFGPLEEGSGAKHRRITLHLRRLIETGKLAPGTRLPNIKALAEQWETNYFTVQSALTPLANEGLIVRNPRRGTFVQDQRTRLSAVALYYGADFGLESESNFYHRMYRLLQDRLHQEDIRVFTFLDTRPLHRQTSPPSKLAKMIERREIQGLIGIMLNSNDIKWLTNLPIPRSLMSGSKGFTTDTVKMFDRACERLAEQGCRSAGVIGASVDGKTHALFAKAAAARGLETRPVWCHDAQVYGLKGETFGYQALKNLWAQQDRPQGLVIEPDWVCRGAITGILELGIRVPDNLRLVLYRNSGLEYLCPWPVSFLELDCQEVAHQMIENLKVERPEMSHKISLFTPKLVG